MALDQYYYKAFSNDVTVAILVLQNNETAAIQVFQTNPLGVELFFLMQTISFTVFIRLTVLSAYYIFGP